MNLPMLNKFKLQTPPLKLPKISRTFTENEALEIMVVGLVSTFLIAGIGVVAVDVIHNIQTKQQIEAERNNIYSEIVYWEKVVKRYPNYRDAYFALSVLEYRIGDIKKAKEYLTKVFKLDPNFKEGKELEKILY